MPPRCAANSFFQAADRQYLAAQRDLAGHRHIGAYRVAGQAGDQRGAHRDTGARAVFRRRPFRHVHVDVAFLVEIGVDAQFSARARTTVSAA